LTVLSGRDMMSFMMSYEISHLDEEY